MMPLISTVRPEPVEGLSFSFRYVNKERQGFDKLSPNGVIVQILALR
jgi:hypothetical protein